MQSKNIHREFSINWARAYGVVAKAHQPSRTVDVYDPQSPWIECFENWSEVAAFFQRCRDQGHRPWLARRNAA